MRLLIELQYEVSDVKENGVDFSFKIHGHKHIFTTDNATHTAGWVKAIKAEIEPAIARKEEVQNSEGFKAAQTSFRKYIPASHITINTQIATASYHLLARCRVGIHFIKMARADVTFAFRPNSSVFEPSGQEEHRH